MIRKNSVILAIFAVFAAFSIPAAADTITYQYTSYQVSGALYTQAEDINNNGLMVGYYVNHTGSFGFIYNTLNGTTTSLSGPAGATNVQAEGINDAGVVVGTYTNSSGNTEGFTYTPGVGYTSYIAPAATSYMGFSGINNAGQISGNYGTSGPGADVFTPASGGYTDNRLQIPGALSLGAGKLNDAGDVVGYIQRFSGGSVIYQGFMWDSTTENYSTFNVPGDVGNSTQVWDINNSGVMVGDYFSSQITGFIDNHGSYTSILYPGSNYTYVTGINDSNEIVGWYMTPSSNPIAFFATVVTPTPEPASFGLLIAGALAAGWRARRKSS